MSPSTAPASTDASCSGSPTIISQRVGAQRLQQPGHHGQRDHGGLVDDDHVVAERVRPVVPEPGAVTAGAPEEPVQRRPAERKEPLLDARVQTQLGGFVTDSFLEPQRCLPRRRRKGDERRCGAVSDRLLVEQSQQARHRRGLPRPWPASDDRNPAQNRGRGGQWLQVVRVRRLGVLFAEQLPQAGAQKRDVDVHHLFPSTRQEFFGHQAFVEPEAVQVQVRPSQVEGVAFPDDRALGHFVEPCLRVWPRQCIDAGRQVEVSAGCQSDRPQVDAHVAEPRRPGREGDPEADVLAAGARELRQTARDVDVGGGEDPRLVEGAQDPGCPDDHGRVVAIEADAGALDRRHRRAPWSKRSLSAVTSSAGGHHDQTPHGVSPTNVGWAALMPRRKR